MYSGHKSSKFVFVFVAGTTAVVLLLSGCYQPGGPKPAGGVQPAPLAWTLEQVEQVVCVEEVSIYSPVPRTNGEPPPEADYIRFLRFRPRDFNLPPSNADAVILLMPGFMCGSNAFDYLGRQIVYMAKVFNGLNIEVWGTERRPNRIEDHTGIDEAERLKETSVAIDYYYHNLPINGRTFEGFKSDVDVPYISEFGLELVMKDVYKIATTMIPSREIRKLKLFIGGHSMGGTLTAFFIGWDFDGNPDTIEDAGFMNCAGAVALDSVISTRGYDLEAAKSFMPDSIQENMPDLGEAIYVNTVQSIRNGYLPRTVQIPWFTPEAMLMLEIVAMRANFDPDGESSLHLDMPISETTRFLLSMLHSRSWEHFLFHVPRISDFRYTNEALLGTILDDNFMPITIMQTSVGFLSGGSVVTKDFPLQSSSGEIPGFSDSPPGFFDSDYLFIANDAGPSYDRLGTGPLYSWLNFDRVANTTNRQLKDTEGEVLYTWYENEVSDIQDLARVIYRGPSNLVEWYFSMRLTVDMIAALADFGKKYGLNYIHGSRVAEIPKIEFIAEQGPMGHLEAGISPGRKRVKVKGYNHMDVLTAAADRPSHRNNEVFEKLLDFIRENGSLAKTVPGKLLPAPKKPRFQTSKRAR